MSTRNDQWGEGEHCPNGALFAQMHVALLTENASIIVSGGALIYIGRVSWLSPRTSHRTHLSDSLLASNTQDIDYIGLSITQHTWQFRIIEAQQHK